MVKRQTDEVEFEDVFPPDETSKRVAAAAFVSNRLLALQYTECHTPQTPRCVGEYEADALSTSASASFLPADSPLISPIDSTDI